MTVRFIIREDWLAGIKGVQTNSGDAGVWRTQSFAPLVPSEVEGMAMHWPGGNGNFASALADPFHYFQQMQIQYRNVHLFDLGYSFGIPPDGSVFEIRGMQFRPASQDEPGNTIDENGIANSIILACDLDGKVTDAQVESARWVIAQQRAFYNKLTWIKGHREIGNNSTVCPGDVLVARIHAGDFEPFNQEEPMTPQEKLDVAAKVWSDATAVPTAATIAAARTKVLTAAILTAPVSVPHSDGPTTDTPLETVLGYVSRNTAELVLAMPNGVAKPLLDKIGSPAQAAMLTSGLGKVTTDVNAHTDQAIGNIVIPAPPAPPPPDMSKVVGHQVEQGDITFTSLP